MEFKLLILLLLAQGSTMLKPYAVICIVEAKPEKIEDINCCNRTQQKRENLLRLSFASGFK